ncbi:MAG: glycosyltransferase family 2 protein [Verrucomicrobiota bacterium]|nr:glycosyltransferase family 2 protein [Verrucomicrobiota bacterium]
MTYNRAALLHECLEAVLQQTSVVGGVIVIDNASSDSTSELFARGPFDPRVRYVRLPQNVGGAGGFAHGLKLARERKEEWFWLMDDDTIPSATCLAELLAAEERFPTTHKPVLLASKVVWTDRTLHPMNLPTIKRAQMDPEAALLAAEHATASVRWASFVSLLVHRSAVAAHGLPLADYFIWNDDTEYTARILREGFGVIAPRSVVMHKTPEKHSPMNAAPARAFYQVRNVLWMILRSDAWMADEKLKIGLIHLQWIWRYLRRAGFNPAALSAVARGLRDGLRRQPKPATEPVSHV